MPQGGMVKTLTRFRLVNKSAVKSSVNDAALRMMPHWEWCRIENDAALRMINIAQTKDAHYLIHNHTVIYINFNKFIPNPLSILARSLPESAKIHQCTFGNMPLSSKCTMHFRWSFIFSTHGLYFLLCSNFGPFEEVKVPVYNIFPNCRIWIG